MRCGVVQPQREDFHATDLDKKDADNLSNTSIPLCKRSDNKNPSWCETHNGGCDFLVGRDGDRDFVYAVPAFCLCHYFVAENTEKSSCMASICMLLGHCPSWSPNRFSLEKVTFCSSPVQGGL